MRGLEIISAGGPIIHICGITEVYRLALLDGRRVYMDWHYYLGPSVYYDKRCRREINNWWKDEWILRAVEWFDQRGQRG